MIMNMPLRHSISQDSCQRSKGKKDEIIIAKEQGYLFDYPKYETHEETLDRMRQVVVQINPKDVANAFLYSLSTCKLPLFT